MSPAAIVDPLRGHTLAEAKDLAARATGAAEAITLHLARYPYSDGNPVRVRLEADRDGYEREAHDWSSRVAEFETANPATRRAFRTGSVVLAIIGRALGRLR